MKPAEGVETGIATTRYQETRHVTLVGAWIDLLLGIAKILVGWLFHSQALVADGIHSLSDLATDFIVLFAAKHADRQADDEHPYGHGRIETLATVGLGIALLLVAAGIIYDAVERMFRPDELLQPGMLALGVAALSVLAKEAIYHYTMHFARKHRSNMLRANAWHSRSDAISSIVVMIGIIGTMQGLDYLDAVAAVVVGVMVAKIAWDLSWHSARELIDTALDEAEVQALREEIRAVPGVKALHMLRTRRSGGDVLVDVHIQVAPEVSVSEGHQIGERVRHGLLSRHDEVCDVTVHIDPEDDETGPVTGKDLPLRPQLLEQLKAAWKDFDLPVEQFETTLHYLNGRVDVDLILPLEKAESREKLASLAGALQDAAAGITGGGRVRLLFTDAQ